MLIGNGGSLGEVRQLVLAGRRGPHRPNGDAGAVAVVDGVPARHAHHGAGGAHGGELVDAVPHDGLHGAGDVTQLELQEALAVALLTATVGADDEHGVDVLAIDQVAHEAL